MRQGRAAGLAGLAAVLLVAVCRARVQQEPWAQTTDSTGINITCSHPNILTGEVIHWYRHLPGRGPAFLVSALSGSKPLTDLPGRLVVAADRRSSALWLTELRLRDAAVYYCALSSRLSATGNYKLTFGSGTRLSVLPKVVPSPSVYRLTTKDDEDLEMCLITDYAPNNLQVKSNSADRKTEAVVEVATSENKQEASYLTTYWAKKDKMECGAEDENARKLEGKDPESGASTVCVTGMSPHFKTDENLNMLSLTQLGLKIILIKGVIFNVVMTILMWKKKE